MKKKASVAEKENLESILEEEKRKQELEAQKAAIIPNGHGRFEYRNKMVYLGEWKMVNGKKVRHGHGKMTIPGVSVGKNLTMGDEEYDGEWENNKMTGHGRYKFASGNVYIGKFENNIMDGEGKMSYMDGTCYEG